jgi:hypothetical protein
MDKERYNAWVTAVHAAQNKEHAIDDPYYGAKRITLSPDVDGDTKIVFVWVELNDDHKMVETSEDGHEEVLDQFPLQFTLDQARSLHQAIGEAIADAEAIPDY